MTLDDRFHPGALLEHAGWMRGLARRLVREDEEDLVQESWLAALKRAPSGKPLGPWLASVTRNLASNRRRGDATRSAREEDHGAEAQADRTVPTPAELVERSEAHRGVVDAVLALDEPIRGTLLLRYFEGLSAPEIAARTGTPQATVRTRLHRGIAKLREDLDASHQGDRKRWVMALTPFAGSPGPAAAAPAAAPALLVVAMTSFKLLALAVPLLVLFAWLRSGESSAEGPAPTSTQDTRAAAADAGGGTVTELVAPTGVDGATAERTALEKVAARIGTSRLEDAEAPAGTLEPRQIQLVDERTGEPVWDYVMETVPVRGHGARTRMSSDRFGNIKVPAGVIGLTPIDRMLDGRQVPSAYGGRPGRPEGLPLPEAGHALSVPFGRVSLLGIEAPAELSLTGAFAELRVEGDAYDRHIESAPLRRFEGRTYARFPEHAVKELTGASLRVLTASGTAGASVEAEPYVGTGVTAPIVFRDLAALTIELVPPPGAEIAESHVTLTSSNAATPHRVQHHDGRIEDGIARYRYLGMAPGNYELKARSGGLLSQTVQVTLTASGHNTQRLELAQDPSMEPVGAADLTFVSVTGAFHRPLWVKASQYGSSGSPLHSKRVDIAWTETKGAWSGTARIEGLSDGANYLEFSDSHNIQGPAPISFLMDPADFMVAPGEPKEILIHDDRKFEHRTVRALDADTLEPIEYVDVQYASVADETLQAYIQGMDFQARLPFLQSPKALKLQVTSDEHIPLDLPEGALADGDLTVKLKRGWGCYFAAMDEGGQLIEGIEVILDGVSAGTTTAPAPLLVTRDRCPDHVTFRMTGWRILSAPFLSAKGEIVAGDRVSSRFHIITVAPQ